MSLVDDFRQQRELKQAAAAQARDRVAAWQAAVATLCKRIEQLLDDSIKNGFIKPEADTVHLRDKITQEQYQIDRLKLRTDGHAVVILSPVESYSAGNDGRVDMALEAGGDKRYALIWVRRPAASVDEQWQLAPIDQMGKVGARNPLSKDTLEEALRDLLGFNRSLQ
jgi:hypothetical protein